MNGNVGWVQGASLPCPVAQHPLGDEPRYLVPAYARVCRWPGASRTSGPVLGPDVDPAYFAEPSANALATASSPHALLAPPYGYVMGDALLEELTMVVADLEFEDERLPQAGKLDLMEPTPDTKPQ